MLSVGRRGDERRGIGLGFGGMEENELEEGEACSGQVDDGSIDPDALSYIDEKLQDVLGHFRKEFDDVLSAENLGAKFGGYGSFLPTYQRSPSIWSQPKSSPGGPSQNVARSPCNSASEGVRQNPSVLASAAVSKNNNSLTMQSADPSGRTSTSKISSEERNISSEETIPQQYANSKPFNAGNQKSLKVRLKVGTDNILARNNAAIYSGLGLNISPSSSLDDSPDRSERLFPEFRDMPDKSPMTIHQIMSCFSVRGGYLLSPLSDGVLHLAKKDSPILKNCKSGVLQEDISEACAFIANLALPERDYKRVIQKKLKTDEKVPRPKEVKISDSKDDISSILRREVDNETPESEKLITDALNISILSNPRSADEKTERKVVCDSTSGVTRVLEYPKESNRISTAGKILSPELTKYNELESTENIENSAIYSSGNEASYSLGKLNPRTRVEEKMLEERSTGNGMDTSSDMWREDMVEVDKIYETVIFDSVEQKKRNGHLSGSAELQKQMSSPKGTPSVQDGERRLQGKGQLPDSNIKLKERKTNAIPAAELKKDKLKSASSRKSKEKKSSLAKGEHSEIKSKSLKSPKRMSKCCSKESLRGIVGDVNAEQQKYRTEFMETKEKAEDTKQENRKRSSLFDKIGNRKVDHLPISEALVDTPVNAPPVSNVLNSLGSYGAALVQIPLDNWVACDICELWRLLPYGMDPAQFCKKTAKWQCSMQTWLPGLNKCHVSETVTTKAFNALYQIPPPQNDAKLSGHHGVVASTTASADALHLNQKLKLNNQILPTMKKKLGLKDELNAKSRSLNDMNENSSEGNLSNKFSIGRPNKSSEFIMEKHNQKREEKHKIQGLCSDGGDFVEKSGKHSKSRSKIELDQDGFRSSKKIKKGFDYPIEDQHSNLDMAGRGASNTDNGSLLKTTAKSSQRHGDSSSSKDLNCVPKGYFPSSMKKDDLHGISSGQLKVNSNASNIEKSGAHISSGKKRKMKEGPTSNCHQTPTSSQRMLDDRIAVTEASVEGGPRKQKKSKVSKSEGKEPATGKTGARLEKGCSARILLSGCRDNIVSGIDEGRSGKERVGNDQGSTISRRDVTYAQPPAAATSSSSKVSSSRKNKASFLEARGSPVESVSSSPLRISNTENVSSRRKSAGEDNVTNAGFSIMGSPKKYFDDEVDGGGGHRMKGTASSVKGRFLDSQIAAESKVIVSSKGGHDFHSKESSHLSVELDARRKDSIYDALSPPFYEEANLGNGLADTSDQYNKYNGSDRVVDHHHDRDKMVNHYHINETGQRKSGKSSPLRFKEKHRGSKSDIEKGKIKVSDVFGQQNKSHILKAGSRRQSEADMDSHGCSTYHEDLREKICNVQDKKEEQNYLGKKDSTVKLSVGCKRDGYSDYELQENTDSRGLSNILSHHEDFGSRVVVASCSKSDLQENLQQASSQQDEKPSTQILSDRIGQPESTPGRGKSRSGQPFKDKQEPQSRGSVMVSTPVKGSRSEVNPTENVSGDALKVVKLPRKADSQSGPRQATPNCPGASSPVRKDCNPAATAVLKEARDLKHTANRLKNEGLELESTGLYFEAALKFLLVASLWEPPSLESAKHGEGIQSMQMYSETARLCEFCAHEYERSKEMAAAALAYKCVEVAYMKVAYYKHPGASKDRHELQAALQMVPPAGEKAALQMVPPGESPSSSASDVDNLNNQSSLDKAASAKGDSPYVAGSHVIAARKPCNNRPNFLRLLHYTNDLNCAFEATRKSQNAVLAAIVNRGKDMIGDMSPVKNVLDFNFHNVEGLLRLVRLARESIGR